MEGGLAVVRRDLEQFISRLAPDGDPSYSHSMEGPDDMPAHIRSVLTSSELSLPIRGGRLALGVRRVPLVNA